MQPKYDYRRRLPHLQKDDDPLFVTFATKYRWILPAAARDVVFECCVKENGCKFNLHAAVVMPDHVPLIYSPLRREDGWSYSLPEIMKAIKGTAAWRINHMLKRTGARLAGRVFRSRSSIEREFGGEGGLHLREPCAGGACEVCERVPLAVEGGDSCLMRSWKRERAACGR